MTRTLRILAALAVLLLSGTVLQAQDTAKQESRRDALRKEIAQLEQQLKENASKSNNAMTELKLVRKQVATRRELVAESEREIRALSDTIAARQAAAERLRERVVPLLDDVVRLDICEPPVDGDHGRRKLPVQYLAIFSHAHREGERGTRDALPQAREIAADVVGKHLDGGGRKI